MKGKTNMGRLKSLVSPHSLPVTKEKAEWKVHLMILTRLLRWPFGVNKLPCPTHTHTHTQKKNPSSLSENLFKNQMKTTGKELNQNEIAVICNKRRITI